MNAEKLSRAQASALARLAEEYKANPRMRHTAYDLSTSLATLNALAKRGLVEKCNNHGSLFCPRSAIFFRYIPPKAN